MKKLLLILAVALMALSVGATTSLAAPTASVAKKCQKKKKYKKHRKHKCKKPQAPGTQGAPGVGPSGMPGTPGTPGTPAAVKVTALDGNPFEATNDTVSLTPDGVEFGPYADSGACLGVGDPGGPSQGSLYYDGLNGQPLSAVQSLVYLIRYTASDDTGGVGVPYLRIFLEADTHDAIFSPNTQVDADTDEGEFHHWVATSGVWRYDDDGGDGSGPYGFSGAPYSTLQSDHGTETVSGIYITTGCSAGHDLAALLQEWKINETNYSFGS